MFTESKKQKTMSTSSNQQNMITQGTSFVGDLISEAGFRIEGNVNGTIKTSGKVVVGKTGVINGTLEGVNADFEGGFSGKLKLSGTLTLKASAYVEGEGYAPTTGTWSKIGNTEESQSGMWALDTIGLGLPKVLWEQTINMMR